MTRTDRIEQFDTANLDLARKVRERPWLFEAHLIAWSRHVIARLGSDEEQRQLEMQDEFYREKQS